MVLFLPVLVVTGLPLTIMMDPQDVKEMRAMSKPACAKRSTLFTMCTSSLLK
jgi:hypothetical protein